MGEGFWAILLLLRIQILNDLSNSKKNFYHETAFIGQNLSIKSNTHENILSVLSFLETNFLTRSRVWLNYFSSFKTLSVLALSDRIFPNRRWNLDLFELQFQRPNVVVVSAVSLTFLVVCIHERHAKCSDLLLLFLRSWSGWMLSHQYQPQWGWNATFLSDHLNFTRAQNLSEATNNSFKTTSV